MLKKPTIIALALLMLTIPAESKTGYFGVTLVRDGKAFTFPIFKSARNSRSVTRINHFLQLTELQSLARGRSKSIFDQVKINDRSIYGGKFAIAPEIYSNSDRILSIGFT